MVPKLPLRPFIVDGGPPFAGTAAELYCARDRTAAGHALHFRIVERGQRALALTLAGGLSDFKQPLHPIPSSLPFRQCLDGGLQAGMLLGVADQILGEVRRPIFRSAGLQVADGLVQRLFNVRPYKLLSGPGASLVKCAVLPEILPPRIPD